MDKYLIVGMGVAGISAAETIRSVDQDCQITIASQDPHGYYSLPGLAYYLANEVPDHQLMPFNADDFQRMGVKRVHSQVTQLVPVNNLAITAEGQHLVYDRLILATGSSAIHPEIPGVKLDGVVFLDSLDDAKQMARLCKKVKSAVVVGGGITAIEIVEGLIDRGLKVDYFLRGNRYWSNVLNEHESQIVENELKKRGVTIHYNTEMAKIGGSKDRVDGVITQNGRTINCGMVAIAIGVLPRKQLAQAAGLSTEKGILVDEYMQTSQSNILAAGDVAQVFDPISKRHTLDTLWWIAREQGKTAGLNATGKKVPFKRIASSNMTRLAGLVTQIIGSVGEGKDKDLTGLNRGDSEIWRTKGETLSVQHEDGMDHIRIQLGEKTITGAVIIGDQTIAQVLRDLIIENVDLSPIREDLMAKPVELVDILSRFHNSWRSGYEAG